MLKIWFLLFCIMFSCHSCDRKNDRYLEIANAELKKELTLYCDSLETVHNGTDFVVRVYCRDINDSIKRFVIADETDYDMWYKCPYHFKCSINNKDVLFVMLAAQPSKTKFTNPFFQVDNRTYSDEAKKYFPQIYETYGMKEYRHPEVVYEPELTYLTFLNGKLIGKCKRMGLQGDCVPVEINKRVVYM